MTIGNSRFVVVTRIPVSLSTQVSRFAQSEHLGVILLYFEAHFASVPICLNAVFFHLQHFLSNVSFVGALFLHAFYYQWYLVRQTIWENKNLRWNQWKKLTIVWRAEVFYLLLVRGPCGRICGVRRIFCCGWFGWDPALKTISLPIWHTDWLEPEDVQILGCYQPCLGSTFSFARSAYLSGSHGLLRTPEHLLLRALRTLGPVPAPFPRHSPSISLLRPPFPPQFWDCSKHQVVNRMKYWKVADPQVSQHLRNQ